MVFDHEGQRAGVDLVGNTGVVTAEGLFADIKTGLLEQLEPAHGAYGQVVRELNALREGGDQVAAIAETELAELFTGQLAEWEASGALDYVRAQLEADPDLKFTLVAQPNVMMSGPELKQLAGNFGAGQSRRALVESPLYNAYSPEELSGVVDNGAPARFLLIPSKMNDFKVRGTDRATALKDWQQNQPYIQVPAPAVAPTFWYTLRENGDLPMDPRDYEDDPRAPYYQTLIPHFDLEPKDFGNGLLHAPQSVVDYGGTPTLGSLIIQLSPFYSVGRFAVA